MIEFTASGTYGSGRTKPEKKDFCVTVARPKSNGLTMWHSDKTYYSGSY